MKIYDSEKRKDLITKLIFTLLLFFGSIIFAFFKTTSLVAIAICILICAIILFRNVKPYFKTISEYRQHVGSVNSFDIHLASFFEPYLVNDAIRKVKAKAFVGEKKNK